VGRGGSRETGRVWGEKEEKSPSPRQDPGFVEDLPKRNWLKVGLFPSSKPGRGKKKGLADKRIQNDLVKGASIKLAGDESVGENQLDYEKDKSAEK